MDDMLEVRRRILQNTPHLESISGSGIVSFNTDMGGVLGKCIVNFSPIQASGTSAPDNFLPISGWTGIKLNRAGRNLFNYANADVQNRKNRNSNGEETNDGTGSYTKGKTAVYPETQYIISGFGAQSSKHIYYLDINGDWISKSGANRSNSTEPFTFTTPAGCYYVQIQAGTSGNASWSTVQIEIGNVAHDFEPYDGVGASVDWTDEAGVIHGGYIDLIKGEIVKTFTKLIMTGTESINRNQWNSSGTFSHGWYSGENQGVKGTVENTRCNMLTPRSGTFYLSTAGQCCIQSQSNTANYTYFLFNHSIFGETVDACKAKLAELYQNGTPLEVTYQLQPRKYVRYPIDPIFMKTLKDLNNIWSTANGNIELNYWTH